MPSKQILVVDDDAMNREVMEAFLSAEDYAVALANTGQRGLSMAQQMIPDLIILDVKLPDMSGYDVCQRLKQDSATQAIPIMIVTGYDEASEKQTAQKSGADDFLSRPFKPDMLIRKVGELMT